VVRFDLEFAALGCGIHLLLSVLGLVETLFSHIKTMMGFKLFSLRGKNKVNGQWQLITMVPHLLKIHRYRSSEDAQPKVYASLLPKTRKLIQFARTDSPLPH